MALLNRTFTALTSGTRDLTSDKGACFILDGSTTGKFTISSGATLKLPKHTQAIIDGAPSHSYMNGTIYADDFKYILKVPSGGRGDFSNAIGAIISKNVEFVYLGAGSIFLHLEGTRNALTGSVRITYDMSSGGYASVQFSSREMANVTLTATQENLGSITVYPARSSAGFTSFPGFITSGITALTLQTGNTSTSHGRIYDPVYKGTTGNIVSLKVSLSGTGRKSKEYFTFNVDDLPTDAFLEIKTGSTVTYSKKLTAANTVIKDNAGAPLTYYSGQRVVPALVRTIGTALSTSRETISYSLRQVGRVPVEVTGYAMNSPVKLPVLAVDPHFRNTPEPTASSPCVSATQIYDSVLTDSAASTLIPADVLTIADGVMTIKTGWRIELASVIDSTADYFVSTHVNQKRIVVPVKLTAPLLADSHVHTIVGAFGGESEPLEATSLLYTNAEGKVKASFDLELPAGVSSPVVGVWKKSLGRTNRTAVITGVASATTAVWVEPNTEYYYILKGVGAHMVEPTVFSTGTHGTVVKTRLAAILRVDGTEIIPRTLTADQRVIANMLSVEGGSIAILIPTNLKSATLPAGAENSRWDSASQSWAFHSSDFPALARGLDVILSSQAFLHLHTGITISDFTVSLKPQSQMMFVQASGNVNGITVNLNAFTMKREGDTTQANTFLDMSGGALLANAGAPVIATITGSGMTSAQEASLNEVKTKTNKLTFDADSKVIASGSGLTNAQATSLEGIEDKTDKLTFDADNKIIASGVSSGGGSGGGLTDAQDTKLTAIKTKVDLINIKDGAVLVNTKLRTLLRNLP